MKIELRDKSFNPWQELHNHQETQQDIEGKHGANSIFVGNMRDFNQESGVTRLYLEHYPNMTLQFLEKITAQAKEKWPLLDAMILHRTGDVNPSDCIVLIAVWSAHRKEAFEACRFIIEELKQRAPFWKKEYLADQTERWVNQ